MRDIILSQSEIISLTQTHGNNNFVVMHNCRNSQIFGRTTPDGTGSMSPSKMCVSYNSPLIQTCNVFPIQKISSTTRFLYIRHLTFSINYCDIPIRQSANILLVFLYCFGPLMNSDLPKFLLGIPHQSYKYKYPTRPRVFIG